MLEANGHFFRSSVDLDDQDPKLAWELARSLASLRTNDVYYCSKEL